MTRSLVLLWCSLAALCFATDQQERQCTFQDIYHAQRNIPQLTACSKQSIAKGIKKGDIQQACTEIPECAEATKQLIEQLSNCKYGSTTMKMFLARECFRNSNNLK